MDDLIRRSDVIKFVESCGTVIEKKVLLLALDTFPSALDQDWRLYEKKMDGRSEYRYGPKWQMTALLVDGGYPTPEEAKLAWLRGNR